MAADLSPDEAFALDACFGDALPYVARRPTKTALFQTVLNHLETFIDPLEGGNTPLARWVEKNLRAFLRCGQPQYGFIRVRCYHCKLDRAVPFS